MNYVKSPNNFGDLEDELSNYENSKAVILPVPYEKTTTYVKGTAKGPKAIIDASRNMELQDEELDIDQSKIGICTLDKLRIDEKPEIMIEKVCDSVKKLISDEKFIIVVGGEHSISPGCVKAFSDKIEKFSVLHLDAHADLREEYDHTRFSHACAMRRVRDINKSTVSVGIRSLSPEESNYIKENNIEIFWAKDIFDSDSWMDDAILKLEKNVYITLDLDVLDPSIMPSTGTPEPGGLAYYQILRFLKNVFNEKNIIGVDVVELCPKKDDVSPDFLAAKLVYKMIGYKFLIN